ncbi:MAG: thioredoxin family protein [Ectobacillus sp.]
MEKLGDMIQVKAVIGERDICLLFIKTESCGVCDAVLVQTEELLEQFPKLEGVLVSMKEVPEISAEYLVFTAPTLLVFVQGKEVMRESRFIVFEKFEYNLRRWYEAVTEDRA